MDRVETALGTLGKFLIIGPQNGRLKKIKDYLGVSETKMTGELSAQSEYLQYANW